MAFSVVLLIGLGILFDVDARHSDIFPGEPAAQSRMGSFVLFAGAKKHFGASLALKDNALACRNLALLHERDGHLDAARQAYERAWSLCGDDANLAVKIGDFLVRHKRQSEFAAFVKSLPAAIANHECSQLQSAQVALERGDYRAVRRLLQREFRTIREGKLSLSDLWISSYIKESEQRLGRELTANEKNQVVRKFPPPWRG